MFSALAGGFGMALSPQGPLDGSAFLGGHGSASPVGYGLDGDGFAQHQPQQHFSVHAALQQHQGYGGGGGGHHGHAQRGSVERVRYPHNHGPESFSGGSPHGGGGDQGLMSWAPGVVEQGHHGGGGGGDGGGVVSRQMTEVAERSADPLLLQHNRQCNSLGPDDASPWFSGASYEPSPADNNNNESAGDGRGAPTPPGAMHAPVPMLRELRRQSSLPHLPGVQPVPTPVRMAQTPPLTLSSRRDFLRGGEDGVAPVSDDDSAVAAAAAAADGGAAEAWERERSRFSVRGRRSPPTESRIAAVAFATRNAATADMAAGDAEQSKSASSVNAGGAGTDGGDAASSASTASAVNTNTNLVEGSAPAESEPTGPARYAFESGKQHDDVSGGGGGGGGLVTAGGVSLGDLSLGERSLEVEGDGAALPGLSDYVSSGHR